MTFLMIVLHHYSIHVLPHSRFTPALKPGMQTTAGTKPFFSQAFPLAATPQHKQDPVHYLSVRQSRSSSAAFRFFRRQDPLDLFPLIIGDFPQRGITHLTLLADCFGSYLQFCLRSVLLLRSNY